MKILMVLVALTGLIGASQTVMASSAELKEKLRARIVEIKSGLDTRFGPDLTEESRAQKGDVCNYRSGTGLKIEQFISSQNSGLAGLVALKLARDDDTLVIVRGDNGRSICVKVVDDAHEYVDGDELAPGMYRYLGVKNFQDSRIKLYEEVSASDVARIKSQKFQRGLLSIYEGMVDVQGKDWMMGETLVSQAQWEAVMGCNPSDLLAPGLPVDSVSWKDCQNFIGRLNQGSRGISFRLPTEEEWKYAVLAEKGDSGYRRKLDDVDKPNVYGIYTGKGTRWEWTSTVERREGPSVIWSDCTLYRAVGWSVWSGEDNSVFACCAKSRNLGLRLVVSLDERERESFAKGAARQRLVIQIITDMVAIPDKNYRMGKTEVTQAQWEAVMGDNPSEFKGDDLPVENVSWDDCQQYIKKLNERSEVKASGLHFRLPTEAEWEYACRAGGKGDWGKRANGQEGPLETMGWYNGNSGNKTHPVGTKESNVFGLYDMHGNVWEWTSTADGNARVVRGGSGNSSSRSCTAGRRDGGNPTERYRDLGFRLAASQD